MVNSWEQTEGAEKKKAKNNPKEGERGTPKESVGSMSGENQYLV